ncbi:MULTISPECIES: tetratricopeptide repeat protein [Pseudofrankia]|uniref:tetratricopeptide repeat protein n=1 Tax=Pseudofrankia TaxID=2994363 RepID=UPI000234D0E9|nr:MULTISPECIES: tetratricopeptide repeat protein [Pseudofrankia]OHV28165.1 hypothetical protein BCD49_38195 [Pseudofrankia sp. EUN1h]
MSVRAASSARKPGRAAPGSDEDTVTAASDLAATLRAQGDHPAARALDEDVLSWRQRVLGEDHPHTIGAVANLAVTLSRLGDAAAARVLRAEVVARRRRVLGENHPATIQAEAALVDLDGS